MLRAIHGVSQAALQWHKMFKKDLEFIEFKFNSCDACEERDIMTEDISNAFMQASLPMKDGDERIHMKITDASVDMSVKMNSNLCESHVVCEKEKKTICVRVLRAICDMSQAALQ